MSFLGHIFRTYDLEICSNLFCLWQTWSRKAEIILSIYHDKITQNPPIELAKNRVCMGQVLYIAFVGYDT